MFIVRSGPPSKYDECSYGSVCKSIKTGSDQFDIYVQMNRDDQNPHWEKVGTFSPETNNLVDDEVNTVLMRK